ncbi:MAG: SGNH/GDSL hydrolase family protein [Bacteroidota bacterium]
MKSKVKVFFIQIIIFLVLGEIGSRLVLTSPQAVQHLHFNTTEIDEALGWKTKSHHHFVDTVADGGGTPYVIDYRTVENGFRFYENIAFDTLYYKILFIGDSYTQAVEVSNDKTYYSLLGRDKDLPVTTIFAYGASGYSTFQEYLVFEKYVEAIQPDLVVWQFCSNDFIDNFYKVEMEADYKIGVRRPYLTLDDEIKYQTPIPAIMEWGKYSRLAFALYILKEKFKAKFNADNRSAELKIAKDHLQYDHYRTSNQITDKILKKIKSKLPVHTQLLFFSADAYDPQMSDFAKLCKDNDIEVELGTAHLLNQANFGKKEMIFAYDNYHWNERGHEVVATALKDKIRTMLLRSK